MQRLHYLGKLVARYNELHFLLEIRYSFFQIMLRHVLTPSISRIMEYGLSCT